ncbi:OmpA family protein [Marivirga atlantica]|jgi:outer membrane protein OmpA-like peptidoglycan-associated protein|uniref:OmpA family protein n=1 Tax=Marivirga atlantica TaxID=1548457 RepID=A0A937AI03_9BACT|nr:OmpA family protein [Marivirga atlantica]MBL0766784.1 OmpA family protein [Marivirga atlantica]
MKLIYRLLLVFPLIFFAHLSIFAQGESPEELAEVYINTAKEILAETKVLTQARDMYVLASQTDPSNVEANFMAGSTYLQTTEKSKATEFLLKAYQIDPNYKFNLLYLIGQGYQFGYDFETAIGYYNQYQKKLEENTGYKGADKTPLSEVERRIYECENGRKYKANPISYSIVNLGNRINSESWDYGPVVNADETVMIFTTRRSDGNLNENVFDDNFHYEDIFISKKLNGEWQPAENIGNVVNTKYHDSNLGFSPDGKTLYIYSDEGNGDIYYTNLLSEDTWSIPESLSDNINSSGYNEKSVSQSADGSLLFYASNRPGGYGGFDIYYSEKNRKGEWGASKNLGDIINTELDEDGCFLQFDGKTLYFSSTGHDGMGGFDIYKSVYDSAGGVWSTPENLGYPLNSPDDDIYFVMSKDGKTGYYASVREDGMGYNDIYRVTIANAGGGVKKSEVAMKENPVDTEETKSNKDVKNVEVDKAEGEVEKTNAPVTLLVRVTDAKSGEVINADIDLKRASDNLAVPAENNDNGIYKYVIVRDEPTDLMLSVQKSGYIFVNKRITIPASQPEPQTIRESISLKKPEVGSSKVLRNIYFDFGKASFSNGSYDELNKMVAFMEQNPNVNVEIAGHTDNIGNDAFNKELSQLRANKVVNYLTKKGIDRRRLTAVGYGEEKPLVSNDDEVMGREINRRVEFIVKK